MVTIPLEQYEKMASAQEIIAGDGKGVFVTPNHVSAWCVNMLYTKEPEIIEWIESFSS